MTVESEAQRRVWRLMWETGVSMCDLFVTHPNLDVPKNIRNSQVRIFPAITDPLDGLNKTLDSHSLSYYSQLFKRICLDQLGRKPSDVYFCQICRFDPSKGILELIQAYSRFRDTLLESKMFPELIVVGHSSIDDPESKEFYERCVKASSESKYTRDIFLVRLAPIDQILNVVLRKALVAFQLSLHEGFEIKVTESLMKGVPVVAFATGGIVSQIRDGVDGFLVTPGDVEKVSELMKRLWWDHDSRSRLCKNASDGDRSEYQTVKNVLRWLKVM
jgi:glycosyltransferase involved in cell wall biosynthesis